MSLDLTAIIRELQEVESQHPDTSAALDPIITALSRPETSTVGTEQARRLLGVRSVNTIKRWLSLGILAGHWDERSGRWQIPLAEVLRVRGTQRALADAGGDDLTEEALDLISTTRPGTFPWQRDARRERSATSSSGQQRPCPCLVTPSALHARYRTTRAL
jgi:hypothetical protein